MILNALVEYDQRRAAWNPDDNLPEGYEFKEIAFVLVLNDAGELQAIQQWLDTSKKPARGKPHLVPKEVKRTVSIVANLGWDKPDYVLGFSTETDSKKLAKVAQRHQAFKTKLSEVFPDPTIDPGLLAVHRFLTNDPLTAATTHPDWAKVLEAKTNQTLAFKRQGDLELVTDSPVLQVQIARWLSLAGGTPTTCLVTGQPDILAVLHSPIKGVAGAQSSGANIVSFNLDAFCSFGKEQGANAPIGKRAEAAYTRSLNSLLGKDSSQRLVLGETTMIFWAAKPEATEPAERGPHPLELGLPLVLDDPEDDNPDERADLVKTLLESPHTGRLPAFSDTRRFYLLGLAPNASRLAVRFWVETTVLELAEHLRQHAADMDIVNPFATAADRLPPIKRILRAVAVQGKLDQLPPVLTGELLASILQGRPYPRLLLQATLNRILAERGERTQAGKAAALVSPMRAALIKACLNRSLRVHGPNGDPTEKELLPMLDETNTNIGYCLGRLFALMERIQESALGDLNASIRDRYYGGACSTPSAVFPILVKLMTYHLRDLRRQNHHGRAVFLERKVQAVMSNLEAARPFPNLLTVDEQGRFAVGYYHQRQALFEKTATDPPVDASPVPV